MDCGLKRYFKWYCYHNPSNIMNNFNLNRGNLDKCQINSQSKYQTRTSWGYFGVSGTMMKTINLYSWLRRLCHLILLSQDSTWVETVCSWRQANQDTICCSSKLAFQKRCFVGFKMCQFSSAAQSCPTLCDPWTAVCQASLSIINSRSLLNSCPLSWWCHPTVSSSVIPFSSYPQPFPASGSFPVSWLFASGGDRYMSSWFQNPEVSVTRTSWAGCQRSE